MSAIKITRTHWTEEAARVLALSIIGAPCFTVEDYRRMIEDDPMLTGLYRVSEGGRIVGFAVLRVEMYSGGAEGVILAAAGRLPGTDLTAALLDTMEKKFAGVKGFCIATARPGLKKKLEAQGYSLTHYVLRKPACA